VFFDARVYFRFVGLTGAVVPPPTWDGPPNQEESLTSTRDSGYRSRREIPKIFSAKRQMGGNNRRQIRDHDPFLDTAGMGGRLFKTEIVGGLISANPFFSMFTGRQLPGTVVVARIRNDFCKIVIVV